MKDDAFDHVIGCVRDRNHVRTRLLLGAFEELIAEGASTRLYRAARQCAFAALDDKLQAQLPALPSYMFRDARGSLLQRVVVMRCDDMVTSLDQRNEQRGAVGTTGNGREHAVAWSDEAGCA